MDDLTQLDASKSAIRDHLDETYGLYGQFYDDFDYKFGGPPETGGLPTWESAIKIEAGFLTYNLGLSRTGIRLFAIEGTPAAQHFSERCTYFDPSPDLSIRLGKKWLGICREHHEKCRTVSSVMPTRVIALGTPGTTPPRLLITAGLCEAYVALSYCWGRGASQSPMLRDESLESMQQEIDEKRLAKTYCEAFQLARDLGIKYIWVDALCIIQGNREDWEYESAKMGEVYGNAALCIVAARSGDAASGFLQNDFKPAAEPCPFPYGRFDGNEHEIDGLFVHLDRAWFKDTLDPDPVQTRGWCLQEAELSRRRLVYGRSGVSFQCNTTKFFEDETYKFYHQRAFDPKPLAAVGPVPGRRPPDGLELLNHWYGGILPDYTARALTNRGDVFAAISSLAKLAKQTIGGRYLAGVWESDLPRGLLWKPRYQTRWMVDPSKSESNLVPLRRPTSQKAPSWSWAAVEGPISHGWDNRKRWPRYPTECRPDAFFVRPAHIDHTRWTTQDDCDADVLYMPRCELQMYGRLQRLRCTTIPQARLLDWYREQGVKARQRPDDLPPQVRHAVLLEPLAVFEKEISLLQEGCPFNQVVAFGVFDIAEERIEDVWALPATQDLGLILNRSDDGTFHRLGIFHLLNRQWFEAGEEGLVTLV
ncbi:HET-domain-containing protein [Stipitochalara longipes BDJ]|nr:HET-domain-containing protein [Stipitochalara longipes BDJ]